MPKPCDSIRRARPLLGTFVEIAVTDAGRGDVEAAIEAAFRAVEAVHGLMSFHDPSSEVSRLNREAFVHAVAVHPWTYEVLKAARELHHGSNGLFDIAVAPVLQRMGLLPGAIAFNSAPLHLRLKGGGRRAKARRVGVDCARNLTPAPTLPLSGAGSRSIELLPDREVRFHDPGLRIDLGGIAKGYAVDRAIEALQEAGMAAAIVNAGGDLAAFGPEPHVIHLRDPRHPDRMLAAASIKGEALATSGRRFDPFCSSAIMTTAVIDPLTQQPAHRVCGATVRARSCMLADALTKVVLLAGENSAAVLARYGASALFVTADGDVRLTSDWQKALDLAA